MSPRTEDEALAAAIALEKEIDALSAKAAALALCNHLPRGVKDAVSEASDLLKDTVHDACIKWSVDQYENDAPQRDRDALVYAREQAAE